jgi:hypothetical protein
LEQEDDEVLYLAYKPTSMKIPELILHPPGSAVKPLLLVAPVFGDCQCTVPASFSFPPAFDPD